MTATDLIQPVLGGARVLVAGGDADDSATLAALLRLNGFDARQAWSAAEALRAVSESRPAVLITDLDLPGEDGLSLVRQVSQFPHPPAVVVVTGHIADAIRRAVSEAGATYLLKPVDPTELAKLVRELSEVR